MDVPFRKLVAKSNYVLRSDYLNLLTPHNNIIYMIFATFLLLGGENKKTANCVSAGNVFQPFILHHHPFRQKRNPNLNCSGTKSLYNKHCKLHS